jgi:hypothetical protein
VVWNLPCGRGTTLPEQGLCDAKARVEPRRLSPVARERLGQARGRCDHRARRLHAGTKISKPPLRDPLVRLPRVVGQAARDLQEAELPRRGRD